MRPTYKFHGAAGAFNDQIGHVANDVSSEAEVKEHVENDEDHLNGVDSMEVTISDGGHGGDGPVHCCYVSDPDVGLSEIRV